MQDPQAPKCPSIFITHSPKWNLSNLPQSMLTILEHMETMDYTKQRLLYIDFYAVLLE